MVEPRAVPHSCFQQSVYSDLSRSDDCIRSVVEFQAEHVGRRLTVVTKQKSISDNMLPEFDEGESTRGKLAWGTCQFENNIIELSKRLQLTVSLSMT